MSKTHKPAEKKTGLPAAEIGAAAAALAIIAWVFKDEIYGFASHLLALMK